MSCDDHFKKFRSAESFLIYAYGFMQHHMIGVTVHLYSFAVLM